MQSIKCPNCEVDLIKRDCDPSDMVHCPLCPFIRAENTEKAEFLYAALSVDNDGHEGICATKKDSPQGEWIMTMVATRLELVECLMTKEFREGAQKDGVDVIIGKFKRVR